MSDGVFFNRFRAAVKILLFLIGFKSHVGGFLSIKIS